jgi:hypothetical protein
MRTLRGIVRGIWELLSPVVAILVFVAFLVISASGAAWFASKLDGHPQDFWGWFWFSIFVMGGGFIWGEISND